MSGEFVDTNILVYAYDPTTSRKHETARTLLERLWESGEGILSVQVLQEFFWTITRKVPKPIPAATAIELLNDLATWNVHEASAEDVIEAAKLASRHRLSFWDAMIVQAAISSGTDVLWTEDLKPGEKFGTVTVQSPFA